MNASKIFLFPRWLMKRPGRWFVFWILFTPLVFFIDKRFTIVMQLLPALVICWLFLGALATRTRREQLLLLVLVAVVTVCEVIASIVLHWYSYRLNNVPLWIPPGHGVVFLTALLGSEQQWVKKHAALLRNLVTAGVLLYSVWGVISAGRDITGALFGCVFLVWLWGTGAEKSRFYITLWPWVCFVELSGVWLGVWHWSSTMPLTGFSEGNPPSGIAGAYGAFDLMAFGIAAAIYRLWQKANRPKAGRQLAGDVR